MIMRTYYINSLTNTNIIELSFLTKIYARFLLKSVGTAFVQTSNIILL